MARDQAISVGCVGAEILSVDVGATGGPEAAARVARYRALDRARAGAPVAPKTMRPQLAPAAESGGGAVGAGAEVG